MVPSSPSVDAVARLGNRVLLIAITIAALAAIGLGAQFVEWPLALGASLVLGGLALGAALMAPDAPATRYVLAFVLASFVALHIQLARGLDEMHFGVFVTLALLLVYRTGR